MSTDDRAGNGKTFAEITLSGVPTITLSGVPTPNLSLPGSMVQVIPPNVPDVGHA